MYSNSAKMYHIYTPRYIKRILGARLPRARYTRKSTATATVTFSWGVYSIEETSPGIGQSQITIRKGLFLCASRHQSQRILKWEIFTLKKKSAWNKNCLSIQLSDNSISFFYISHVINYKGPSPTVQRSSTGKYRQMLKPIPT